MLTKFIRQHKSMKIFVKRSVLIIVKSSSQKRRMSTANAILRELQGFDSEIEEVIFTCDCTALNERKYFSQIIYGLLFIIKRTSEPKFQLVVKRVVTGSELCRWEERFEEVPNFLLPRRDGFVVFFNNPEDSTLVAECIRWIVYSSSAQTVRITEITEVGEDEEILEEKQRASGVSSGQSVDHENISINIGQLQPQNDPDSSQIIDRLVYLQNTRVIMAMIAVLVATVVLTVGLNPPSTIDTFIIKIIFQVSFWIAAVFSLAALLMLGIVTPTSFDMQARILGCAYIAIEIAMICVVVAFAATTFVYGNQSLLDNSGRPRSFDGTRGFSILHLKKRASLHLQRYRIQFDAK